MAKKSAIERYKLMDETSSKEYWNDDFGRMIILAFERAIENGEVKKTVEELIDELEVEFNKGN